MRGSPRINAPDTASSRRVARLFCQIQQLAAEAILVCVGDAVWGSFVHEQHSVRHESLAARADASIGTISSDALCLWTAGSHAIGRNATDRRRLVRGTVPRRDTEALHS